jgi:hypothetical protein
VRRKARQALFERLGQVGEALLVRAAGSGKNFARTPTQKLTGGVHHRQGANHDFAEAEAGCSSTFANWRAEVLRKEAARQSVHRLLQARRDLPSAAPKMRIKTKESDNLLLEDESQPKLNFAHGLG